MAFFDENIYREPTWEEMLTEGFEFELYTFKGWIKGTFPSVLDNNKELDEYLPDDEMRLAHAITRIKKP